MKTFRRILIVLLILIVIVAGVVFGYGYFYYKQIIKEKPLDEQISEIRNEYTYVKKEDIPDYYFKAVVDVEDSRFYSHKALDPIGIARAIFSNIKNKALNEGGSTITQQVAKNIYFMKEDEVIKRKLGEIFVANDIENNYSKEDILEIYVNIIYYGNGYYGLKEACNGYLKKEPKDITLAEAAMLAGIPNAPSVYAPTENKDLCKSRLQKVLDSMVAAGDLSEEEAKNVDTSFIDAI